MSNTITIGATRFTVEFRASGTSHKSKAYVWGHEGFVKEKQPAYRDDGTPEGKAASDKAWKIYRKANAAAKRMVLDVAMQRAPTDFGKWVYSAKAGCGCGCSPGFTSATRGYDVFITGAK